MTATADFHLTLILTDNNLFPPAPSYVGVVQQPMQATETPPATAERNVQFTQDGLLAGINETIANSNGRYEAIPGQSATLIATLTATPGALGRRDFIANIPGGPVLLVGFVVDNVIATDSGGERPPPATGNGNPAQGTGTTGRYAQKNIKK